MAKDPYRLDPDRPETWKNFPAPYLDPRYVRELIALGGLNRFDEPNLIFEWGCSALEEYEGKKQLKHFAYAVTVRKPGHPFMVNGVWAYPSYLEDIAWPRWFVSSWIAPEIAGPDWPRGRYGFFMKLDGDQGRYSEINRRWMERIAGQLEYTRNRTDATYAAEVKEHVTGVDLESSSIM